MNTETGRVLTEAELKEHLAPFSGHERKTEKRKWRNFEIGERVNLKGMTFTVHEVGDQRIVLKFARAED
jgi:hypothetical protein